MAFNDYFSSKSGAYRPEVNLSGDSASDELVLKNAKKLQHKLNLRAESLEYVVTGSARDYHWTRKSMWTLSYVLAVIMVLCAYLVPKTYYTPTIESGMFALGQKPGSVAVKDENGEIVSYSRDTRDGASCARTLFASASDYADVKEYAYALYQIGNIGMLTADYSGYVSKGYANSVLMGTTIPLTFNLVDVRDNTTGTAYRYRLQNINNDQLSEENGLIVGIAAAGDFGLECEERRYYTFADSKVLYENSHMDYGTNVFSVTNSKGVNYVDAFKNPERKVRFTNPIPYTMAGYKGSSAIVSTTKIGAKNAYYDTVGNVYGTKFDSVFGASVKNTYIPFYLDSLDFSNLDGRTITYEKTDQHVFYDAAGNADYNTIKDASVNYVKEEEYYEVEITLDCTKDYTSADTCWAVRDKDASNDSSANFTEIKIKFQLWDNGYFKQWEMWEVWYAAHGPAGEMGADQYYFEEFTYDKDDCTILVRDEFIMNSSNMTALTKLSEKLAA